MPLSKELLDILVCPKCRGKVTLLAGESAMICAACGLSYPIRDGIPVMLVDEAEKIGQ